MKDDRLYLIHISECISRIERYTAQGKEAFFADTKTQDAVLRNLQTLAEPSHGKREQVEADAGYSVAGFTTGGPIDCV